MSKRQMVFINGEIVDAESATIHISDLSIQRGYGVFDFFKTVGGVPMFLEDHLDRLHKSTGEMQLNFGYDRHALKQVIFDLMGINQMPLSGIKITVTGGYAEDGYTLASPNLIITQQPLTLFSNEDLPALKLVSYEHQRQMAHIKTIDYLMAVWLQPYIKQHLADDVLYHNKGIITECPRSNFFIVTNQNVLVTPVNNVLYGVTRTQILRHCKHLCLIEQRDITLDEVYNAKEAFVTSTSRNVFPVIEIDNRLIGTGQPGQLTKKLQQELLQLIAAKTSDAAVLS